MSHAESWTANPAPRVEFPPDRTGAATFALRYFVAGALMKIASVLLNGRPNEAPLAVNVP